MHLAPFNGVARSTFPTLSTTPSMPFTGAVKILAIDGCNEGNSGFTWENGSGTHLASAICMSTPPLRAVIWILKCLCTAHNTPTLARGELGEHTATRCVSSLFEKTGTEMVFISDHVPPTAGLICSLEPKICTSAGSRFASLLPDVSRKCEHVTRLLDV